MLNLPHIIEDANIAGIRLTDLDQAFLKKCDEHAQYIVSIKPEAWRQLGLNVDAATKPQLALAWEVEFFINQADGSPLRREWDGHAIVEAAAQKCDFLFKHQQEQQKRSVGRGKLYEAASKAQPYDETIANYYKFRKVLAEECAKKGYQVNKLGTHLHFSLMDQQGNKLTTTKKKKKLQTIGDNLTHIVQEATPLFAMWGHLVGVEKHARTHILGLASADEHLKTAKDYAVRAIYDIGRYVKPTRDPKDEGYGRYDPKTGDYLVPSGDYLVPSEESEHFHWELRRQLPGGDRYTRAGFDGFTAGAAAIAGAIRESIDGQRPTVASKEMANHNVHYEDQLHQMRQSKTAQRVFGANLVDMAADTLRQNCLAAELLHLRPRFGALGDEHGLRIPQSQAR